MSRFQKHGATLQAEQQKESDNELVSSFLLGEASSASKREHPIKEGGGLGAPAEGNSLEHSIWMKRRQAFDPPEEPRFAGTVSDDKQRAALSNRNTMMLRADVIMHKASHISIKEATSLEQRRAKEESMYHSFEELHEQQNEIFELKQKMELDKHDSNYGAIHTLLFGPKPQDCNPLGEWDIYNKVQEQLRKFAYHAFRPTEGSKEADSNTTKLQERLHRAREQIEEQRHRIKDLTSCLKDSVQEISSLRMLLAEKNEELTQMKQKNNVLQAQMKHLKDHPEQASPQPRRQSSVNNSAAQQKERENAAHEELLQDFQQLVNANLQLEQENIMLRARIVARGMDPKEIKALLPTASSSTDTSKELADRQQRRDFLKNMLPTSSAVLRLKQSREKWMSRSERLAVDALAAHDTDANVELMRKPLFDARKPRVGAAPVQPVIASRAHVVVRAREGTSPQPSKQTTVATREGSDPSPSGRQDHASKPSSRTDHGGETVYEESVRDDEEPSSATNAAAVAIPVWHALQTRMLAGVAISRADCLRREALHINKLRHRLSRITEEASKSSSERNSALARCEKAEQELSDTKNIVKDLIVRCEKLTGLLEEAEQMKHHAAKTQDTDVASRFQSMQHWLTSMGRADSPRVYSKSPSFYSKGANATERSYTRISAGELLSGDDDGSLKRVDAPQEFGMDSGEEQRLRSLNEIMSRKVEALEVELNQTRDELHATQAKLIRDGVFYVAASESASNYQPSPPAANFESLRIEEEQSANSVKLALRLRGEDDDDSRVTEDPPASPLKAPKPAGVDDKETLMRMRSLEQEVAQLRHQSLEQLHQLRMMEVKLRAAEDSVSINKTQSHLGLSEKCAHRVVPKLREILMRVRAALRKATSVTSNVPSAASLSASDEDEAVLDTLLSLVEPGSEPYKVIMRQRFLRSRVEQYAATSFGQQQNVMPSALSELRIQWLRLLAIRERQLGLCTTAASKKAVRDLLRQTYEALIDCEIASTHQVNEDLVCFDACKRVLARSDNSGLDNHNDLADIRSSQQLERELMAQTELRRSLVQLAQDIEVKRAEVIAADNFDSLSTLKVQNHVDTGVIIKYRIRGNQTMFDAYGECGYFLPTDPTTAHAAVPMLSALSPNTTVVIPIFTAVAASTIQSSYRDSATFYIRYLVQRYDSPQSIRARFHVGRILLASTQTPLLDSVPEMPLAVDVAVSCSDAVTFIGSPCSFAFATVQITEPISLGVFARGLNVDISVLNLYNSMLPANTEITIPCECTNANIKQITKWSSTGMLAAVHRVQRHESVESIALRFSVDKSWVTGTVEDGNSVFVALKSIEAVRSVFSCPAFDAQLMQNELATPKRYTIEGTTTLSEVAKHLGVSRTAIMLPNLDVLHAPPTTCSQVECLVPCQSLDQLKHAVQTRLEILAINKVNGSLRFVHTVEDALDAIRSEYDALYAVVVQPAFDRDAAATLLSCDPKDVLPWEIEISKDSFGSYDVVSPQAFDQYIVEFTFAHKSLKLRGKSDDEVQGVVRALQQDILEIVTFACEPVHLKRCVIPFVDVVNGNVAVQIVVANETAAQSVALLIEKDGTVSHLSHLRSALLDVHTTVDESELVCVPLPGSLRSCPSSSVPFYYSVSGSDTMTSISLKYGVRTQALLTVNAASWLRKQQTSSTRKSRRRVLVSDSVEDSNTSKSEDMVTTPLRKLQIYSLLIPTVMEMTTLRTTSVSGSLTVAQAAGLIGVAVDKVFVHAKAIELNLGGVLRVPPRASVRHSGFRGNQTYVADGTQVVVSNRGDTLDAIAHEKGVPIAELLIENTSSAKVKDDSIVSFQSSQATPPNFVVYHAVTAGETLWNICDLYGAAPQHVLAVNPALGRVSDAAALLVPVQKDAVHEALDSKLTNVFTLVADVGISTISRTFGCATEDVERINSIAAFIGKKWAPVCNPVAIALARRQDLTLYSLVGMSINDTLLSISDRSQCHIGDLIRAGVSLYGKVSTIKVHVSYETAARITSAHGACNIEHVDSSLLNSNISGVTKSFPGVLQVTDLKTLDAVKDRLSNQAQRRARFAQRLHFFDDQVSDVSSRLAVVQREINVVERVIERQKALGEYESTEVVVNREHIAIQTDDVIVEVSADELRASAKVPHHSRNTQTMLTGEAVENTLFSVSEAQGKEILLETELQEARATIKMQLHDIDVLRAESTSLRELVNTSDVTIQSYAREKSQLELRINDLVMKFNEHESHRTSVSLLPKASIVSSKGSSSLETKEGFTPPLRDSKITSPLVSPSSPSVSYRHTSDTGVFDSSLNASTPRAPPVPVHPPTSSAAGSFNLNEKSNANTAVEAHAVMANSVSTESVRSPPKTSRGVAVQTMRITTAHKESQTGSVDESSTDGTPSLSSLQEKTEGMLSMEFESLHRMVHVAQHSARDNERAPKDSKLPVAIAFTDIQSSTTLWSRVPDAMATAVEIHHDLIRKLIDKHEGYEVKTIGDSFMVAFSSADNATAFALELQTDFHEAHWPQDIDDTYLALEQEQKHPLRGEEDKWNGLRVRVGMNWGHCSIRMDSVTQGYDYYGTLVNTAARVEGVGNGGQVLLTEEMMLALDPKTLLNVVVQTMGPTELRGLDKPVVLYQLSPRSLAGRKFAPLRLEKANEMSEDALTASFANLSAVSEAEARAKRAEAAAHLAAVRAEEAGKALLDEKRRANHVTVLSAPSISKEASVKRSSVPSTVVRRLVSLITVLRQDLLKSKLDVSLLHGKFAEYLKEGFKRLLEYLGERHDKEVVEQVSAIATQLSHDIRGAIITDKVNSSVDAAVQSASPTVLTPNIPPKTKEDFAFASHEISKFILQMEPTATNVEPPEIHNSKIASVAAKAATPTRPESTIQAQSETSQQLPPIPPSQAVRKDASLPMRRSVVSNIVRPTDGTRGDTTLQRTPTPPMFATSSARVRTPQCIDTRGGGMDLQRQGVLRAELTAKLLKTDPTKPRTPPFEAAFVPQVGATVYGIEVSPAAERQLRRVKQTVHDEVLAALRMDFGGLGTFSNSTVLSRDSKYPLMPIVTSLSVLRSGALHPAQVEAVANFRKEQEMLRKEKARMLLRRVAVRVKAQRLLSAMSVQGYSLDGIRALWRQWMGNWHVKRASLITQERANVEALVELLSTPRQVAKEFVPFLVSKVQVQSQVSPRQPDSTLLAPLPTNNRVQSSSSHFRFAQFKQ